MSFFEKYSTIAIIASYLIPIFLLITGFFLLFATKLMLEFTKWFEKGVGAEWIPSKRTESLYKIMGIIFLSLGSFCLGYLFGFK